MGLLDRARNLDDETYSEGTDDPSRLAGTIISSFRYTPDNIDYPGEVFRAFQSLIGFKKGSLMLPDNHGNEYYPWISVGFDRTSTRRLRIPFDFPAFKAGNSTLLDDIAPDSLAQMLSNREYGSIRRIMIIRLGPEESPSALLLVADCPWTEEISSETASAIQQLSDHFGNSIEQSRMMMDSAGMEEITDLSEWFDSWGMNKATLVTLDITNAIDVLIEAIPGLELYRGRRDVVNLLRHIIGRMGRLHDLKDSRVLILFPPERLPDHALYIHQLSRSFASAFYHLPSPPDFPAEFRIWPDEKDVIEENLAGFF
ncbi:MAG: hypothetical protein KAJ98_03525 [Spirochaetaceae bacterium]|nr:hypothetical protein [Spirochaetaceae bacterium]